MMLSDVCRVHRAKSRTERPRKTKIGTEVARVTRVSDTTFRVKGSKVKVTRPLCSLPCWRVGSCSGGVGTCWPWGNCCYVAVCSAARGASAPTGGGEGRGHIVAAARLQLV